MNLDELAYEISKVSSEKVAQDLSKFLVDWKNNDETVEKLKDEIERYLGNTWLEKNEDHEKIYQMWSLFRATAISGIDGMTINERLYAFSLFERFDDYADENSRLEIYKKLHANPWRV